MECEDQPSHAMPEPGANLDEKECWTENLTFRASKMGIERKKQLCTEKGSEGEEFQA